MGRNNPVRLSDYGGDSPARIKFDEMLLKHSFELLGQNCLNARTINQMLKLTGEYYYVSRAYIVEFSEQDGRPNNVFSWCKEGADLDVSKLLTVSSDRWRQHMKEFDSEGIYSYTSVRANDKHFLKLGKSISSLQCVITNQGGPRGIAFLDDCTEARLWTRDQIDILVFLSKIVGCHLQQLQTQKLLCELSTTDVLTGVRSFEAFHIEAEALIKAYPDKRYALVTCDLEHFKDINDAVGHDNGDQVIIDFSSAIRRDLDTTERIGRVSADIFTMLVGFQSEESLKTRMDKWVDAFHWAIRPLNIQSDVYVVAGVYPVKSGETYIPVMIDRANAARKLIKGTRDNGIRYYDHKLHQKLEHEKDLEKTMMPSLKNEDFVVYLQPKFRLSDREIVGAEALVRWEHPTKGFILPSDFIPLFEKNRFIVDLDFYVFDKVCALLRKWIDNGKPVVPVSVNFSRIHLLMPEFASKLTEIIKRYSVSPGLLEIELTESAFIDKKPDVLKIIRELKNYGFTISMDDFGSGYSSLNALKDMPIDVLKLDKGFFQNKTVSGKEKIILEGFVEIARKMDLYVVSEGVETEMQAEFLKEISCDFAQGYYFARPVPIAEFEAMLDGCTDYC